MKSRNFELLPPALAMVALTLMCVYSAFRLPFWFDELLTHYVVSDHSFAHMLGAEWDLINTTPPLYFIVMWPVAQIIGATELPLRLFSSLGISISLLITWQLLRRLFDSWSASTAVVLGFLGSSAIWYQNMEGRCYGLFLAETAIAVVLAVRMMTSKHTSWKLLLANTAVHAALVTTHYFGFLYSGAILLACIVCWIAMRTPLAACVSSSLVGWLAFVPCIPIFIHHLEFNHPHGWISTPTADDLLVLIGGDFKFALPAAAVLVCCGMVVWRTSNRISTTGPSAVAHELQQQRQVALVVMLCILCVPLAVWLQSELAVPMFLPKYFLPDTLAWCYFSALGIHWIFDRAKTILGANLNSNRDAFISRLPRVVCFWLVVGYLIFPARNIEHNLRRSRYAKFGTMTTVTVMPPGPHGEPVVFENVGDFLPINYYSPVAGRFFVIVDRDSATDRQAWRPANNLDQIAAALKCQYPDLPILTSDELQQQFGAYVVVDSPLFQWFERNVENCADFQCDAVDDESQELVRRGYHRVVVSNLKRPTIGQSHTAWRRQ